MAVQAAFAAVSDVAWAHLLVVASHLYLAAIMMTFSLLLQHLRIQRSRLRRVSAAVLLAGLLLVGQPLIFNFRATHQPWGIGLAAIAFMAACTLVILAADTKQRPATAMWALGCLLQHINYGVVAVHKRRRQCSAAAQAAAAPASTASSTAPTWPSAADSAAGQQEPRPTQAMLLRPSGARKASQPHSRPIIHVEAVTAPAGGLASPASKPASHQAKQHRRQLQTKLLREAGWVLLRQMIAYDVGMALLCCSSGCWCSSNLAGQAAPYGVLQDLLGPLAGRLVWSWAAGLLLPMQMGIGYAVSRLLVVALGRLELAQDMPAHAFHNLLAATSISDMWGNRWHQFLRFYFKAIAFPVADTCIVAPLQHLLLLLRRPAASGKPVQQQHPRPQLLPAVSRTLCVFALSGLLHEYLTLAAFGRLTGSYVAFFMLHGLLVTLEGLAAKPLLQRMRLRLQRVQPQPPASNASPAIAATAAAAAANVAAGGNDDGKMLPKPRAAAAPAVPRWRRVVLHVPWLLCWCYTVTVTVLLSPLFVEPYRQAGYFSHSWHAFGSPVAATALAGLGLCGCD